MTDVKLYLGDCLEVMRGFPDKSVDAVITDPPYGIKRFKKGFGYTRFKGYGAEKLGLRWDNKPEQIVFDEIFRVGKDPFLQTGKGRRPDTFQQKNNEVAKVNHPCPKPNNVMRWIIERTTFDNTTILDPFMGSGTTGVACVQTGRNFIGIEICEEYFRIAEKRIAEAQMQPRLI